MPLNEKNRNGKKGVCGVRGIKKILVLLIYLILLILINMFNRKCFKNKSRRVKLYFYGEIQKKSYFYNLIMKMWSRLANQMTLTTSGSIFLETKYG